MRDELVGTEVVVWEFGWGPIGKEGEDWLDCDVLVGEAREEGLTTVSHFIACYLLWDLFLL